MMMVMRKKRLYLHVGGGEKNNFLGRNTQDEKNFVRLCYMIRKENNFLLDSCWELNDFFMHRLQI